MNFPTGTMKSYCIALYMKRDVSLLTLSLPLGDVLDEVFSICRQDVMGRTSYSNSDCSSKLRRGSGEENERLWLAELLCDTLFWRNCMGCTHPLAGKGLIPAYQVCYQCCYWRTTTHPQCCYVSLYLAIVRRKKMIFFKIPVRYQVTDI